MSALMGPVLAGAFISTVLYGITVLQTYQYFNQYWLRDRWYLRIMVVVLALVDLLVNVMDMVLVWDVLISGTSAETATTGAGVIAFIVQLFYAYRLWILSIEGVAFVCSRGDFLISTSMIVFLMRSRQVGLKSTDHLINKLVIYTINSGLLTMICNAMALTLTVVYPRTFYYMIFYFSISTCYVTSVLAVKDDVLMKFDTAGSDRDINPPTEISTFRIASPHMVSRPGTPLDLGEGSLP
ncbi:hypothetical protein BDZ89DRAFT_1045619 [Hymenopellis radicata]|nr:hypothetical protein BDZ89DRAFT_1045619 [Hymenopellis radicata]